MNLRWGLLVVMIVVFVAAVTGGDLGYSLMALIGVALAGIFASRKT
jgi:hypothetical protein